MNQCGRMVNVTTIPKGTYYQHLYVRIGAFLSKQKLWTEHNINMLFAKSCLALKRWLNCYILNYITVVGQTKH